MTTLIVQIKGRDFTLVQIPVTCTSSMVYNREDVIARYYYGILMSSVKCYNVIMAHYNVGMYPWLCSLTGSLDDTAVLGITAQMAINTAIDATIHATIQEMQEEIARSDHTRFDLDSFTKSFK